MGWGGVRSRHELGTSWRSAGPGQLASPPLVGCVAWRSGVNWAVPLVSGRCSDKQVGKPGTQASFAAVAASSWCGKKGIATGNTQVSRVRGNWNGCQPRWRVGRRRLIRVRAPTRISRPPAPPLPPARPLPCCPRSARLALGPALGFSAHSGPLRAPSFALQLGVCVEQMTAVGGHTRVDTRWGRFRGICVQVLLVSKKEGWGRGGLPWGTRLGGWRALDLSILVRIWDSV